jgi:hypothetical protein
VPLEMNGGTKSEVSAISLEFRRPQRPKKKKKKKKQYHFLFYRFLLSG